MERQISPIDGREFRDVLGHFPTGVAVVTGIDADGSTPLGMAVGSFTSVSLDPPLVAFLPTRSSTTFPAIRESGRFCANILAGGQEALSQAFATKGAERFDGVEWRPAPKTGSPVLAGSIAWVDCEITDIHEAGDHYIVIGRVVDLAMQSPALPLLFFQGGYGTFTLRSLVLATRGKFNESARIADEARADLEHLSADVGLECRAFARTGDELVIVATTGYDGPADRVGVVLPYQPPYGVQLAAWSSPAERNEWLDASPQELSSAQKQAMNEELDEIRRIGWGITYASEPTDAAEKALETMAEYGLTPRMARILREASRQITGMLDRETLTEQNAGSVRTITAPVLSAHGPEFHLTLRGFVPGADLAFVEHARDQLVETSRRLSLRLGGSLG